MSSYLNFQIRDYSDEKSTVSIPINDVTDLNFDDLTPGAGSARGDLQTAIEGVTIGNIAKYTSKVHDEAVNDVRPTDAAAQREAAIRIYARGQDTNKLYTLSVPCPNFDVVAQAGTDLIDLTGTEMAALVTALETHWQPPLDASGVLVEKAVLVGRRS